MKKQELNDVLSNNTYPGRGICLGVDESGEYAVIVYFIMGRSINSRNRIFEETDDGIITKAHDESLMTALRTRTFEDDRPNWTPRISGLVRVADGKASYKLSIIKSDDGDESSVLRYFYEYAQPKAGEGHFIHTYQCDGNPIPSFAGEPEKVALHGDIEQLALDTWMNLNEDNKVSLYVSYISLADGSSDTIIINKHDQEEEA